MSIGFGQRRAAVTMWAWTASLGAAALATRFIPFREGGDWHPWETLAVVAIALGGARVLGLRRLPARDRQAREPARPPAARGGRRSRAAERVSSLHGGTVTFVFTDIEGSTRLLERLGDRYAQALGRPPPDRARRLRRARRARARHAGRRVLLRVRACPGRGRRDRRGPARAHDARLAGRGGASRPDERPHRRARRRRGGLRRDRRPPRGADLLGRPRRPGAALGDDRGARLGGDARRASPRCRSATSASRISASPSGSSSSRSTACPARSRRFAPSRRSRSTSASGSRGRSRPTSSGSSRRASRAARREQPTKLARLAGSDGCWSPTRARMPESLRRERGAERRGAILHRRRLVQHLTGLEVDLEHAVEAGVRTGRTESVL